MTCRWRATPEAWSWTLSTLLCRQTEQWPSSSCNGLCQSIDNARMYVCTCVRTYVCMYVCMYICMYVRVCISGNVHMHVHVHVWVCTVCTQGIIVFCPQSNPVIRTRTHITVLRSCYLLTSQFLFGNCSQKCITKMNAVRTDKN